MRASGWYWCRFIVAASVLSRLSAANPLVRPRPSAGVFVAVATLDSMSFSVRGSRLGTVAWENGGLRVAPGAPHRVREDEPVNKVTLLRNGKLANLVLAWPGLRRRRPRNAGTPWHRRRSRDSVRLYGALSTPLHLMAGKISPGSMGIYVSVLLHISQVQAHANPRRRSPDEGGDWPRCRGRTALGRRPRRRS